MKRAKKMLLLFAAMAVVFAGYAVLSHLTPKEDTKDKNKESSAAISVASINSSNVSKISWSYSGETVAITRKKDGWKYSGDENFPLDQTKAEAMLSALSAVKASRKIESPSDLSEYGLDKPGCTIDVQSSDGSKKTFAIGSKNEVTNGYYLQMDGGPAVYLTDDKLPSSFSYKLMDMVAKEQVPYFGTVNSISIGAPGKNQKLVYMKSAEGITYTDAYTWFYEDDSDNTKTYSPLSSDKVTELQDSISGITWNGCADYYATAEKLKTYGLSEPQAYVSVNYSVQSDEKDTESADFNLLIGSKSGDQYYAMIKGSHIVYLVDASFAEKILALNYDQLRPDDVCRIEWKTVDSLDVEMNGKAASIYFDRAGEKVSYKVGDSAADAKKVEAFLDGITGLKAEDQTNAASQAGQPEATIIFHRNTKYYKTMTFKLSAYNDSYDLVEFAGQSRLLIRRSSVKSLQKLFSALMQP